VHPSEAIRGRRSQLLRGRRIVLGISGSIAAIETPRIARELIRHGAQVDVVMSADAQRLITAEALRFATGREPIVALTGEVEHVRHLGPGPERSDLLLLCPATANTVSKIAHGIDDTPVTTFASIALGGGVPVLIASAMHQEMTRNPAVQENVERLRKMGVEFIPPVLEEGEAKLPGPDVVAAYVLHRLARGPWAHRRVLVVGGSTSEPIDDVRSVTNEGTGRTAVDLAVQAFYRGADVHVWMGRVQVPLPSFLPVERFRTIDDLATLIGEEREELRSVDAVLVPAALSDFRIPKRAGKISSKEELSLRFERAEKVLPLLRKRLPSPKLLVAFKLEAGLSASELAEKGRAHLKESGANALVANDRAAMGAASTEVLLLRPAGKMHPYAGPKDQVAGKLLDDLADDLPPRPPAVRERSAPRPGSR
jgi:phosphopantothenoylcysteine decarboxylase / phosphopantothenate---cysteine ligase